MPLKLISLNIYGNRFLERQLEFFSRQDPDVICLQEVFEQDLEFFAKPLGMQVYFASLVDIKSENRFGDAPRGPWGVAILTKQPLLHPQTEYYQFNGPEDSIFPVGSPDTCARALIWGTVKQGNEEIVVATTHFTWAPNANPTPVQMTALAKLQEILKTIPEFILTGDFNAPRGFAIFDALASNLKDNIPTDVTTTIDQNLHRVKGLQLVIDVLFSTPAYEAQNVMVMDGVSDHCAILAEVKLRSKV